MSEILECAFKFKLIILKTLKEVQLKREMSDLYSYTEILINTDMLAFRF